MRGPAGHALPGPSSTSGTGLTTRSGNRRNGRFGSSSWRAGIVSAVRLGAPYDARGRGPRRARRIRPGAPAPRRGRTPERRTPRSSSAAPVVRATRDAQPSRRRRTRRAQANLVVTDGDRDRREGSVRSLDADGRMVADAPAPLLRAGGRGRKTSRRQPLAPAEARASTGRSSMVTRPRRASARIASHEGSNSDGPMLNFGARGCAW